MAARIMTGTVVSDRAAKTIVVRVDYARRHPLYSKSYVVSSKIAVHDETNQAHLGDKVQIQDGRPISKTKSWRLIKILERAVGSEVEIDESAVEAVLQTKPAKAAAQPTPEPAGEISAKPVKTAPRKAKGATT